MRRITFTGTRNGMTAKQAATIAWMMWHAGFVQVRHGGCKGADDECDELASDFGNGLIVHPGNVERQKVYQEKGRTTHPALPYLTRNRVMVDRSDEVWACPSGYKDISRGSGTWATIRWARRRLKLLTIVWPDGTTSVEGTRDGKEDRDGE